MHMDLMAHCCACNDDGDSDVEDAGEERKRKYMVLMDRHGNVRTSSYNDACASVLWGACISVS